MSNTWKLALALTGALALGAAGAQAQQGQERGGRDGAPADGGAPRGAPAQHAAPTPQHSGPQNAGPQSAGPQSAGPRNAGPQNPGAARGEAHPGPRAYQRPSEPQGWNQRPATVDRPAYQHNFQAARSYHVGPYHPPEGWNNQRWAYGQTLPRAYWASQYYIGDYWLFGLETPPGGYQWVRSGDDAVLIDTNSGEILQVEYGVFE